MNLFIDEEKPKKCLHFNFILKLKTIRGRTYFNKIKKAVLKVPYYRKVAETINR